MNYSKKFNGFMIILVFTICSIRISYSVTSSKHKVNPICTNEACAAASQLILNSMNTEANPCYNFYEFACGKFVKETQIPDGQTFTSTLRLFADEFMQQLRGILLRKTDITFPAKPYDLLTGYYEACMSNNHNGVTSLKEVLKKLGGWPIITNDWDENSFEWSNTIYQFRETGFGTDYLLKFSIEEDMKYKFTKTINIDQVTFELDRSILIQGEENIKVDSYYQYMIAVADTLGRSEGKSLVELRDEMKDVLRFEIELAKITEPETRRQDLSYLYNPYSIGSLERQYSSIPWKKYIEKIVSPVNISLIRGDIINVKDPAYIHYLDSLLKNTKKRTIANYLFWRAISSSAMYLGEDMIHHRLQFEILVGRMEVEPRWKACISAVTDNLSNAIDYLYTKLHFSYDSKKDVQDLLNRIRSAAQNAVGKADWIAQESTRTTALKKLSNMTSLVGYEDDIESRYDALEYYYEKLEMNPNEYFLSYLNLSKFDSHLNTIYMLHGIPNLGTRRKFNSAAFCGGYDMKKNKILLSSGMLQHPIYSLDRPAYLNYGQLGVIIGHEITHAFDDMGSHFDASGKSSDWWDAETKEKFAEKKQCLNRQYSDFLSKDLRTKTKINNSASVGENIADNGGIALAYDSYTAWLKKYLEDYENEQKLPGLQKYTGQQMFWINAAIMHCTAYNYQEQFFSQIKLGEHAPGQFRVIGPFRNNENFARDFNCSRRSKMNPSDKCKLW